MKKTRRLFALLTTIAMLCCCLPVLQVSAANTVDTVHLRGDLNGDSKIDASDLTQILSYLNGDAAMPAVDSVAYQAADIMNAGLTMEDARRIYRVANGMDTLSTYCPKAETVAMFNELVNIIKSTDFRQNETMTYFSRSDSRTKTENFDFGIYTATVRELYSDEDMNDISYTPVYKNAMIRVSDDPNSEDPAEFLTNYPAFSANAVSLLREADVNTISITRGAMDIYALSEIPESYVKGTGEDAKTIDLAAYKAYESIAAGFTDCLRMEVKINNESYDTVKNLSADQATALYNLYGTDMRDFAAMYPYVEEENETGFSMRVEMNLKSITTSGKAVYYLDPVTLNPIAAIYDVSIETSQNVTMALDILGSGINGTMDPTTTARTTYVFFFDSAFGTSYTG